MSNTAEFRKLLDEVIDGGTAHLSSYSTLTRLLGVQTELEWSPKLKLLVSIAGDLINPWREDLTQLSPRFPEEIERAVASLKMLREALDRGLLTNYRTLVTADILGDLMEQGQYLLKENYHLAAGVIFRAVLEERLRELCATHTCLPPSSNINKFNHELYRSAIPMAYNKSVMMQVTAMAAVGNDAAHNTSDFNPGDVPSLYRNLTEFLAKDFS